MTEFSAYKQYTRQVERLVDDDVNADRFFNSLNTENQYIQYEDNISQIFDSFEKWSNRDFIIFPTTIQIYNKDTKERSTHSILLIWKDSELYLYDPNGVYNTEEMKYYESVGHELQQDYGYEYKNEYFGSTEKFQSFIKQTYHLDLHVPKDIGAQVWLQIEENTSYIGGGGYCMFFNYMVIEYILKNHTKKFSSIYNTITTPPFRGVFPKPASKTNALNGNARENTFEGKTFAIVEKVFSYNGGKRTYTRRKKVVKRNTVRK
jgi:hypothetical protein